MTQRGETRVPSAGPIQWPEEGGSGGALAGLRVLDLSKFWAGPSLTEVLGNMGAEVFKIEAIQAPDAWRTGGARLTVADTGEGPTYERSPIFNAVNRNKFGLTLDLTRPAGRDVFASDSLRPRTWWSRTTPTSHGELRPGLRRAASTQSQVDHDLTARFRGERALGTTSWASPTRRSRPRVFRTSRGIRGGRPMLWGCAGADALAGMMGVVAVMCALEWRRKSGRG